MLRELREVVHAVRSGSTVTSHPVVPSPLGRASAGSAALARASDPGPIRFQALVATRWTLRQQTMVDLKDRRAVAAGLLPGDVAGHHLFYTMHHPAHGLFLVDSGVARGYRASSHGDHLSGLVRRALRLETMDVLLDTASWLDGQHEPVAGVFLTHLHADHLMGLEDLPAETALYVGPEARSRAALHALSRGSTNRLLARFPPLRELPVAPDPSGLFAGVVDLFGDESAFAFHVPGHTAGSLAFFLRTERGPVLLTGDAARSTWGWEHGVPSAGPGTRDLAQAQASIDALRSFAAKVPGVEVHLGHQRLG